ncbi:1-deoxy-D-xylulose-5-phosphate synthase [Candidatus Dependentiae bacterium]|nr:1-deoxy-D-xylulose-5-phosphate synthase [Candidatus Dependentiae bacterium]
MRTAFMQTLIKMAEQDPNLYLIVGDVGFSVIEEFQQKFHQRYINAGVAEQSMIGLAAGLAIAGKNVFVYSIVPFVTMRCFEQIRNDLCYQYLPVKIVGNGGGLDYGSLGATHHAIEDIAIMRSLPHMTVLAPGSSQETRALTQELSHYKGPAYLRLSRSENNIPYRLNAPITIGTSIIIIPHDTCLLVTTGNTLDLGYDICKSLKEESIALGLVSVPTIKPLNLSWLSNNVATLFTLEEHNTHGGFGEAIGAYLAQSFDKKIFFKSFAIEDKYCHEAGKSEFLRNKVSLNRTSIIHQIKNYLSLEKK